MFKMDLKSNGIAWVGNIYQKFEAVCQEVYQEVDGIMTQEKAEYIESQLQTGCDNIQKFCAEVMQDLLLPPACDVKGPVSDLSLIYALDVVVSKKPKAESPIDEKTLLPAEDVFVSPKKGSSPAPLPDKQYNRNKVEACGALTKKSSLPSVEITECNYPIKVRENHSDYSDACDAFSSALPSDSVLLEGVTGTSESHVPMSSVLSLGNDNKQHDKPTMSSFVLSSSEIGLIDWEEASMSTELIDPSMEIIEEFEDLKVEEDCTALEAEKNENSFINLADKKKRSYKKKLRDVFTSRMRYPKHDHKQLAIHCHDNIVEAEHSGNIYKSSTSTQGSDLKTPTTSDICESEWELL